MGKGDRRLCLHVLRAVLANSPNSVPPERVFSVLNDTFEDDMDSSHADYIELSLQLQYNGRAVERGPSHRARCRVEAGTALAGD